jgi:hypothetical protein
MCKKLLLQDNPEDVIFELNRVAHGQVFGPPLPSADIAKAC